MFFMPHNSICYVDHSLIANHAVNLSDAVYLSEVVFACIAFVEENQKKTLCFRLIVRMHARPTPPYGTNQYFVHALDCGDCSLITTVSERGTNKRLR